MPFTAASDGSVTVDFTPNEASLAGLQSAITKSIAEGFQKGFQQFSTQTALLKGVTEQVQHISKAFLGVADAAVQAGHGIGTTTAVVNATSAQIQKELIRERTAFQATKKAEIEATIAASKQQNIAAQTTGQLSIVHAREFGQQRVQITRAFLEAIGRLEKGLGTVIEGVAKTAVSVVSKLFSGLGSLFKRSNAEITEGLSGQLDKRTGLYKESFSKQETIVKQSARAQAAAIKASAAESDAAVRASTTFQERQLAELHAASGSGVIGAASKSGLFGGLLLGAGLLSAAKSTFTVGSDFVRGLAVLQTQLGLTAEQMKAVNKLSIDLGNDVSLPGVSALDAANAIQVLTKQFGSLGPAAVDAAEKAAKGTLQLSRATGATADEAAAVIGSAVNVFGVGADKAVQVADQITGALTKAAGVSFTDFADSFRQGASVFSSFVVPAEGATQALTDFNAALAVLAKSGLTGAGAGASLKQFFQQGNAGTKSKNAVVSQVLDRAGAPKGGSLFFDETGHAREFATSIDILRKGLAGLTEAEKNHDLQVLFGSRGIQAANALLRVSTEEYAALREGISRQGLAAAVAAAQNTGLKGALDATGSIIETVQILLYEKVQPILGKIVLGFANFANAVLFSGGAMTTVREVLLGVVAGIGALIALKGAIEIITLIGRAFSLLLSPMGIVVLLAAAVGAAISLASDKTSAFGERIRDAGRAIEEFVGHLLGTKDLNGDGFVSFGEIVAGVKDKVIAAFHAVITFFTDTVEPALVTAFNFVKGIIIRDVIPAITTGIGYLTRDVAPALVTAFHAVVDFFANTVGPGLATAFRFVKGIIERDVIPAIKTFIDFVGRNAGPVISAVGSAIATAFDFAKRKIGEFVTFIQPYVQPIIDSFKKLGSAISAAFSGDFSKLGSAITSALKSVAPILAGGLAGLLVGGPIGGIIGAGAGFIGTNFGGSILSALKPIGTKIVDFLKSIFTAEHLKAALSGVGNFVEKVGEVIGKIVSNPKFIAGVAIVLAAAARIGLKFVKGFAEGVISNIPRLLGDAASIIGKILFNPGVILEALLAVFAVSKIISLFRSSGGAAGDGFLSGMKARLSSGAGFLQGLFGNGTALANAGNTKNTDAESTGLQNQLRAFGSTTDFDKVKDKISAMKTELGNYTSGLTDAQQKGLIFRDKMSQVFTGLGSAITGGAGIVKGIGQIGAAIVRLPLDAFNGALNKIATTGQNALTDFLGKDRLPAIGTQAGEGFMANFKSRFSSGVEQIKTSFSSGLQGLRDSAKAAGTTVGSALGKGIGSAALIGLAGLQGGRSEGASGGSGFLSVLTAGLTGLAIGGPIVGAVGAGAALIGTAIGHADKAAADAKKTFDNLAAALSGNLDTALHDGTANLLTFKDALASPGGPGAAGSLGKAVSDALGADSVSVLNKLGVKIPEITAAFVAGDAAVSELQQHITGLAAGKGIDPIVFSQNVLPGIKKIGEAYDDLKKKRDDLQQEKDSFGPIKLSAEALGKILSSGTLPALDKLTADARGVTREGALAASALDNLATAAAKVQAKTERVDSLKKSVGELNSTLDLAKTALDGYVTAIADAFAGGTPATTALDNAVVSISSTVAALANVDFSTGALGEAQARQLVGEFGRTIGTLIGEDIKNGTIKTIDDLPSVTQPALVAGLAQIDASLAAKNITPELAQSLKEQLLAAYANGLEASKAAVKGAIATAGILNPLAAEALGQTIKLEHAMAGNGQVIGGALGNGVILGIRGKIPFVATAAAELATAAIHSSKVTLGINSPSKVMYEIGTFVGEGLTLGMKDSTQGVADILSGVIDNAIAKANGSLKDGTSSLRNAAASIFGSTTGSSGITGSGGTASGGSTAIAGVTSAFQSIRSGITSVLGSFLSATSAVQAGTGGTADAQTAGSNPFSLSPSDVLGAQNLSSFTSALDAIATLGKTLITQGAPIGDVTGQIHNYIGQLELLGGSLGFNQFDMAALVEQLGLSDSQLGDFTTTITNLGTATTAATLHAQQLLDLTNARTKSDDDLAVAIAKFNNPVQGLIDELTKSLPDFLNPLSAASINAVGVLANANNAPVITGEILSDPNLLTAIYAAFPKAPIDTLLSLGQGLDPILQKAFQDIADKLYGTIRPAAPGSPLEEAIKQHTDPVAYALSHLNQDRFYDRQQDTIGSLNPLDPGAVSQASAEASTHGDVPDIIKKALADPSVLLDLYSAFPTAPILGLLSEGANLNPVILAAFGKLEDAAANLNDAADKTLNALPQQPLIVQVNLPSGDPFAAGLAAANAVALRIT